MHINTVTSPLHKLDTRTYFDRTVTSQFKQFKVSITTTYMNGKPMLKHYVFKKPESTLYAWKYPLDYNKVTKVEVDNKLNIII